MTIIKPLTFRTLKLLSAFHQAISQTSEDARQQLKAALEERKETILDLMKEHPDVLINLALPSKIRDTFPEDLQSLVEEETSIEGSYEKYIADNFEESTSETLQSLLTDDGKHIELHFVHEGNHIPFGSRVLAKGVLLEDQMALATDDASSLQILEMALLTAEINYKTAVILINFQNNPIEPFTLAKAKATTFTDIRSTDTYYQEVSEGKIGLIGQYDVTGDVYGWFTIPYDNTHCDSSLWAQAARNAVAATGVDITAYDRFIYGFPTTSACSWGGLGGGKNAWINSSSFPLGTVTHEIGHTLGEAHAGSYNCYNASGQKVSISTNCTPNEYGDLFSVMGTSSAMRHLNNYQKGWLLYQQPPNTVDVTASGIFTLFPQEIPSTEVRTVRIPRNYDLAGNVVRYYYLEFRQPYGNFDNFSSSDPVVKGVSIRLGTSYTSYSCSFADPLSAPCPPSLLIDGNPSTLAFSDAPLAVGQAFEDPIYGITVITRSVTSTSAQVEVILGPITCNVVNPSLTISPASVSSYPGDSATFSVTLKNNNTSVCDSAVFNIVPTLPVGWTQSPSSLTETLASGASITRTISVTSPLSAETNMSYTIKETAVNMADNTKSGSSSVEVYLQEPDIISPMVTITSPLDGSTISGSKITIAATATDNIAVDHVTFYIDGVLKVIDSTTPYSYSWSTRNVANGSHIIQAMAFDSAGNSASHSITVIKSSTTGGGGKGK